MFFLPAGQKFTAYVSHSAEIRVGILLWLNKTLR